MSDILRSSNISPEELIQQGKNPNAVPASTIQGVGQTGVMTSESFAELNDPLSAENRTVNKPASSIPSIFARPIFFHTCLGNIRKLTVGEGASPVYNQIVSQWLDLMEMIFNDMGDLTYEKWVMDEQVEALRRINCHEVAQALEMHMATYFPDIKETYIILKDGKPIGGTSPYTFVYTSTNWKSNLPVKALIEREDAKFREFMYKVYFAFKTLPQEFTRGSLKNMLSYLKKSYDKEPDANLKMRLNALDGAYSMDQLYQDYEIASYAFNPGNPAETIKVRKFNWTDGAGVKQLASMHLVNRKPDAMQSDFFIDSDRTDVFDVNTTPIVLTSGDYEDLFYYDDTLWNRTTNVPQDKADEYTVRRMPDCKGYQHIWLTDANFIEDKLVELPYDIDENKFDVIITNPQKPTTKYLVPIKPLLFKYFSLKKVKENLLIVTDEHAGTVTLTLYIPVRDNSGQRKARLKMQKIYKLASDVVKTNEFVGSTTIGISPFLKVTPTLEKRINATLPNAYFVMLQHYNEEFDVALKFFCEGAEITPADSGRRLDNKNVPLTDFYKIENSTIDVMRLTLADKTNPENVTGGVIIPKMPEVQPGMSSYFYAIDFGTTNTHVAYMSSTMNNSVSFGAEQIRSQAAYLAKEPNVAADLAQGYLDKVKEKMDNVYGAPTESTPLLNSQARAFFPNFAGEDYSFPIRTALYRKINAQDKLFIDGSVGFRYPKEKFADGKEYVTSIKWDLNAIVPEASANIHAQLFFEELLRIVRNHWLAQDDADKADAPVIAITYPLAIGSSQSMREKWHVAYRRVFGVDSVANSKIKEIAESLAPAILKIHSAGASASVLNVDIGGGTTDIQYYQRIGDKLVSRYNSVQFAGDDLWGTGYENVGEPSGVVDNLFTRMADRNMTGSIKIGFEEISISSIRHQGKERINMLLRDSNEQFIKLILGLNNGQNLQRQVLMLHYAALLYHIVQWVNNDKDMKESFPQQLNFSGYGSKYIQAIFGTDNIQQVEALKTYTMNLLKEFGVESLPANFTVNFESKPKNVTAEGAALYVKKDLRAIRSVQSRYFGFDETHLPDAKRHRFVTLGEIASLKPEVQKTFRDFVAKFQKVTEEDGTVSPLSDDVVNRLIQRADQSYDDMYTHKTPAEDNTQIDKNSVRIEDSLFFWMLKGSLFNLDN